jgi:hypothetical protein
MFQASNGSTEVPIAYKSFVACQRTKERESETQIFFFVFPMLCVFHGNLQMVDENLKAMNYSMNCG